MPNLILPPGWQGRERDVTPRHVYQNRRQFAKLLGLGAIGLTAAAAPAGCATRDASDGRAAPRPDDPLATIPADAPREGSPAPRNTAFAVPERPLSDRIAHASYNNFYEFQLPPGEKAVWPQTGAYDPFPATIEVTGLVEEPFTIDVDRLIREMELEERIYRFRCVEAWSMTVPWTGFPLRALIERCRPLSSATHVAFTSLSRPRQMPGVRAAGPYGYEFPYYEGLRMAEATNDLAFVATGSYGEPLPKQNGSPLRLVLPWKYGYKGPKAVAQIAFVDQQPRTFWNDLQPREYGFLSNVNPNVPHPRWTQARERFITADAEATEEIPTMIFNGYDEWVADLYPDEPRDFAGPVVR